MENKRVQFTNGDKNAAEFFYVLRKRIDAYFRENSLSKHCNRRMVVKTVVLLSGYILPFALLLWLHSAAPASLLIWAFMGVSVAGIGMCVMHDANHNAYSSSKKVNAWLGHTLNLLGGSVYNWNIQHNQMHHTYTNIVTHDYDVQDKGLLRFSPHTGVKWFHRLQPFYALPFYSILTLYWTLVKDFAQFFKYIKEGTNKASAAENRWLFVRMTADKLVYFFIFLALPVLAGMSFGSVLGGFLLMHGIAGIILTLVFQLAHTVEGTTYPMPNEAGTVENSWAIHQLNTTVNFATKNKTLSWYLGGLNFQVEHHLFPSICHVHYFHLAPIVKQTAAEFGIPYMENDTLADAVRSHFRALGELGRLPHINEAIV